MTVKTPIRFDVDEFARAYAQWDIDALLDLYADDLELVQIDRDNPPSAPRVRHGKTCCAACSSTMPPPASRRRSRTRSPRP